MWENTGIIIPDRRVWGEVSREVDLDWSDFPPARGSQFRGESRDGERVGRACSRYRPGQGPRRRTRIPNERQWERGRGLSTEIHRDRKNVSPYPPTRDPSSLPLFLSSPSPVSFFLVAATAFGKLTGSRSLLDHQRGMLTAGVRSVGRVPAEPRRIDLPRESVNESEAERAGDPRDRAEPQSRSRSRTRRVACVRVSSTTMTMTARTTHRQLAKLASERAEAAGSPTTKVSSLSCLSLSRLRRSVVLQNDVNGPARAIDISPHHDTAPPRPPPRTTGRRERAVRS